MISYVIPTHNRPGELRETVRRIQSLGDHAVIGGAEIIVVDNASSPPVGVTSRSPIPVRVIRLETNRGAAARNDAAQLADRRSEWLVMLDDDSYPLDDAFLGRLIGAPSAVAAITADIVLPGGTRESGGLPEVPIGCGVAVRAELFRAVGGYDAAFDYYAEEYDLAAKFMLTGHSVAFDPGFRVMHRKVGANRDFGRILHRLVRNNGWVIHRYAPDGERDAAMRGMLDRYGRIAVKEGVAMQFALARAELERTLRGQQVRRMDQALWDRFTGLRAARDALRTVFDAGFGSASLIEPGKHAEMIERALLELGIEVTPEPRVNGALVIGTLSPGPMIDAMLRHGSDPRVAVAWDMAERFRPGPVLRAAV